MWGKAGSMISSMCPCAKWGTLQACVCQITCSSRFEGMLPL